MTDFTQPLRIGAIHARNRIVMAPMTRSRAASDGTVSLLAATYYAQRASHGLIITEGAQPSPDGQGYLATPGLHTPEQVTSWRQVTDAVHHAGGRIVAQLMHVGRVSHPSNTPHGRAPVAPSPVAAHGEMFTVTGMQPFAEPRELREVEVAGVVAEFRDAARAAIDAGFDGVEIHGANGYLLHQFLSSNANLRTDQYGGDTANRIRFAIEVTDAVVAEIGADRTGFRISPGNPFNDIREDDPHALYEALVRELTARNLAYLHLVQGDDEALFDRVRELWGGTLIVNRAGTDPQTRLTDLDSGRADAVAFAALALANPDLPEQLRTGSPLNEPDPATFYGGGHHGYIDYPSLGTHATDVDVRAH